MDIRDTYLKSARVAMNLRFWEYLLINLFECTPNESKKLAIKLNDEWEKDQME